MMFKYEIEQKSYNIGKYSIGGDPRKAPTALAGSIFYLGQKNIFLNEKEGTINKDFAANLIKKQEEIADKTGLVPLLDVVISTEQVITPIMDFVFNLTETPILVDAPTVDVKAKLIKYIGEIGGQNRVIYNSLTPESKAEEFQLLKENKFENFILLALETSKWTTNARMDVIKNLIVKVKAAKFAKENFFVDCCVIDFTSLGLAMNAMEETKMLYGFPVGCGAHNAVDTWRNLKAKFGDIKTYATIVASTITLGAGADFILYGPIKLAELVYPNVAFIKAAHSQLLFDEGKFAPPTHPVFKIG
jgi:N5-methyltetrahydromethanopterin:coenzyme M methyltransferase subunit H